MTAPPTREAPTRRPGCSGNSPLQASSTTVTASSRRGSPGSSARKTTQRSSPSHSPSARPARCSGALHLDSVARLTPHPTERDPDDNDQQDADLAAEPTTLADVIDVPEPQAWLQAVAASRLAAHGVLHIEFGLVRLDRYRADERLIAGWLDSRSPDRLKSIEATVLEDAISAGRLNDAQVTAVRAVAARPTTVLTGGPGTGKTWTVATVLRALRFEDGRAPRVALAAPTGKAAARMNETLEAELADASPSTRRRPSTGSSGRSPDLAHVFARREEPAAPRRRHRRRGVDGRSRPHGSTTRRALTRDAFAPRR